MADQASFADDISTLWGPDGEGMLTPAFPPAHAPLPQADADEPDPVEPAPEPAPTNGNGFGLSSVAQATHDDVARLAQALAANHVDVVRRADLDALRSELEGAFTHQLAVALYELMAASSARFATAEDHINQRVSESVEVQTNRLVASMEAQQRLVNELAAEVRTELAAIRSRLNGPIDGLHAFQRELRHEVGRLGDLVSKECSELARRSDEYAAAAQVTESNDLPAALRAVQGTVSALRQEIAELRDTVGRRRLRDRATRRRARTS